MPRPENLRRAFSLIETLSVIVLVSTIGVIATRVIVTANKAASSAASAQAAAARFDNLLDLLRRDVWNATGISTGPEGALTYISLTVSDKKITWTFKSDGTASRDETPAAPATPPPARTFTRLPALTFSVAGPALRVTLAGKSDSVDTLLPSQRLLAETAR